MLVPLTEEGCGMRIGVMVGPERGRYRTKIDRLRADARWADEAAFASVWVPQIPRRLRRGVRAGRLPMAQG